MLRNTLLPPSQILRLLWGAMLMSQVMFLFVSLVKAPLSFASMGSDLEKSSLGFVIIAIATFNFLVSLLIPKFYVKKALALAPAPTTDQDIARFFFLPFLFRLAMSEAVTLFGFVLASETKNAAVILPFLCASLFIFSRSFPRPQLFKSWLGNKTYL